MKMCVYGGQYGSEGKGSVAEYLARNAKREGKRLIAVGENAPNSGHTCSLGKTRNIPAVSYFADTVIIGPDGAIDLAVLMGDLANLKVVTGKSPRIYIHEHAAFVCPTHGQEEVTHDLVERISSTGSGSGASRALHKGYLRQDDAVVKTRSLECFVKQGYEVTICTRFQYLELIRECLDQDVIMECSQGTLLDQNWGIYPYVTSRSTLARVAVERNALFSLGFQYVGVYRTYPIRTGGPSGPTGGKEITFADIGVPNEIATVTKRIRRVFEFSRDDFQLTINLNRPWIVAFTHLDYIGVSPENLSGFMDWYRNETNGGIGYEVSGLILSNQLGEFVNHSIQML